MLNIENILLGVPITLLALTVHECSHGWVSDKLGDPTPRAQGRLTLNPLAHLDIVGTILMIITGFGWAKPVVINPNYYKDRKKGMALCAAAGPLSNFLLAFFGMLIGYILLFVFAKFNLPTKLLSTVIYVFAWRNLCFMVFNLIPLPPLDGFKVAGLLIPNKIYYTILRYEQFVIFAIMALSIFGVFDKIIGTGVYFFLRLIDRTVMTLLGIFL